MPYISALAIIPQDVHKKIATHIISNSVDDALSFAQSCSTHCRAIVEANEGKLTISDTCGKDLQSWISIMGITVEHLDLYSLRLYSVPTNFYMLPYLREASIYGNSDQIQAIRYSSLLTRLTVVMHPDMNWELFVATVSRLPLQEFRVRADWSKSCLMEKVGEDKLLELPKACPLVSNLDVRCTCSTRFQDPFPHWKFITCFQALDNLVMHKQVVDSQIPFLRKLSRLDILFSMRIRDLARIGPNISRIWHLQPAAGLEDIEKLSSFRYLRELRVRLIDGAEHCLVNVASHMEVLFISWGDDKIYREMILQEQSNSDVNEQQEDDKVYYTPDEEVLETIVRKAKLRAVVFTRAMIKIELVEKIIEICGDYLHVFGVQIDAQEEPPVTRIERILAATAAYCPNLKHIEIPTPLRNIRPYPATRKQRDSCFAYLNFIKRNSPCFRMEPVWNEIDAFELTPEN